MLRMLHREFFKLSQSTLLIIGLIVLLGVNIAFLSKGFTTSERVSWYYERSSSGAESKKLQYTKRAVGLPDSTAKNLDELVIELKEYQFKKTLSYTPVFINILVLPFLLVGLDFHEGSIAAPLRLGVRRSRISAAKVAYYYIIAAIISILSVLIVLIMYSTETLINYSFSYILRCILMHTALDLAALSLPLLFVFILKKPLLVIIASVISCIVNVTAYTKALNNGNPSLLPLPMLQSAREAIWQPNAEASMLAYVFIVAALYITVCSIMVKVTFSKTRLK
jgi:hypothetical protein